MTKVINLLDKDADLKAWYQIAEAQKQHFERSASKDGFYSIEFDWETSENESLYIINFMVKKQKMRDASFADPDEPKPTKRRRKANRGGRPRL